MGWTTGGPLRTENRSIGPILIIAGALLTGSSVGSAEEIETLGSHCNDAPFGSDGGGISACIDLALRYGDTIAGIGIVGVTPEQTDNNDDPLAEKARIAAWIGRQFERDGFDFAAAAHVGIEGGAADDLAIYVKEQIHRSLGFGNRALTSQNGTTPVAGVSGWIRTGYGVSESGAWAMGLSPYAHGALGLDTVEAGAGIMLTLQPRQEDKELALVLPKNGVYAPVYGGDGIGIFGGVRTVAHESLYEDLANPLLAEAGVTLQTTMFDFVRMGISASCTTDPYEGVTRPDCKMNFQLGGLF